MGQILSHSEVEAILSSLDLTPATASAAASATEAAVQLPTYDFEHPEPLKHLQLDALRLATAAACQKLQSNLSEILKASVEVSFLGVEQSTGRDYIATASVPCCLAAFESDQSACRWLLELDHSLVYVMIDCLLGGQPTSGERFVAKPRPFTNLEERLIERVVQAILPELVAALDRGRDYQTVQLVSDSSLVAEASSNEAVALVSFEIACGPCRGLMQLCLPWKQAAMPASSSTIDSAAARDALRRGAIKVPVTVVACVARLKLSAIELSELNPGDVLLTDRSPQDEICLEVDGRPVFSGSPGQSGPRKAILLSTPAIGFKSPQQ